MSLHTQNWSGHLPFHAARFHQPTTLTEVQSIVRNADKVKVIGARHCFNDIADTAGTESVQAARDSTIALLSYKPESVDKDLTAARDRLTGSFLDAYTQLVNTVVIPGAKEKKISAVAQVPAAASVSAKPDHAVVLAFVDQTVVVGNDAPTRTASSVRITLEKVDGRWLISGFEPV